MRNTNMLILARSKRYLPCQPIPTVASTKMSRSVDFANTQGGRKRGSVDFGQRRKRELFNGEIDIQN